MTLQVREVPATAVVGAKDGAIAPHVDLLREKSLTEERRIDLGLCPKGNRKPWPDLACEVAWSDLFFAEMVLTPIMEHGWQGVKKRGGDRMLRWGALQCPRRDDVVSVVAGEVGVMGHDVGSHT